MFNNASNYDISGFGNFKEEELKYISNNKKELLDYYQNYNGKEFKYFIFPKLLYDNTFFKNNKYIVKYNYNFRASQFMSVYKDLIQEVITEK